MWKLIDKNGHQLNPGDYVTTISGEMMVLRDWSPPPTSEHRGRVVLHDKHDRIREHCVGSIGATCIYRDRSMKLTIAQTNAFVTAFKDRSVAQKLASQFDDDPEITANVIERKDGKFVIELRNEINEFMGCL